MRTTALLLTRDLQLSLGERKVPDPAAGEVVLAVEWAGVCGSDLHVLATGDGVSDWPATLGHEVCATVVADPAGNLLPGRRVVVDSRVPCGGCPGCARSARLCSALGWLGEVRPGGFAGALLVPAAAVHPVPDHLPGDVAVLAEPLAVVLCALDQVRSVPRRVLLIGAGPVGALAHAEVARRWPGAAVTVSEPAPARAQLAATRGGAAGGAVVVADLTGVGSADLVVDAAGHPGSLADALAHVEHGGTVLLVALSRAATPVVPADLVERSVTLVGSVGFDDRHLADAIALLAAHPGAHRGVVTHRVPLADLPDLLAAGRAREGVKVLVRCQP